MGRIRILPGFLVLLVLLLQSSVEPGYAQLVCFPGESCSSFLDTPDNSSVSTSLPEQVTEPGNSLDPGTEVEDLDIEERSSYQYGWRCFATIGHVGTCRTARSCRGLNYSYSASCGFSLVCCQDKNQSNQRRNQVKPVTTTLPPINVRDSVNFPAIARPRPSQRQRTRPTSNSRPTTNRSVYPGCGNVASSFIIGGKEAKQGDYPFMVSFLQRRGGGIYRNFCAGVLITSRHVLTAAHCLANTPSRDFRSGAVSVKIGLVDLQERDIVKTQIQSVATHPAYKRVGLGVGNAVNDIAIVKLNRNVSSSVITSSRSIIPVCLPTPRTTRSRNAKIAGWGNTESYRESVNKLRYAKVDEYSQAVCAAKYSRHVTSVRVGITDKLLCAGNEKTDSCNGDSGGPLLWTENFRVTVGGVASFGPSNCGSVIPGVYTKVESYLDWIYKSTDGYL